MLLHLYTLYSSPADAPGKYVLRRFQVGAGTIAVEDPPLAVADTMDEALWALPPGLTSFPPDHSDHPSVVRSWM